MPDSAPLEQTTVGVTDTTEIESETTVGGNEDIPDASGPRNVQADESTAIESVSSATASKASSDDQEVGSCPQTSNTEAVIEPSSESAGDSVDGELGMVMTRIVRMQAALEARLLSLETAATQLATDAEERAEHRENREALYEKLAASTTNFHFQLLRPLLQRISLLYDLVSELGDSPPQDARAAVEALRLVKDNLREVMELNGVETISPVLGDTFDRRFHHVVTTEQTTDETKHESIARTVTDGFLYFGQNERTGALRPSVIRPARVVTWKFDPNSKSACGTTESSPEVELDGEKKRAQSREPECEEAAEETSPVSAEDGVAAQSERKE